MRTMINTNSHFGRVVLTSSVSIKSFPRNGTHPPLSSGQFSFWTPYVILQHKGFEIDIFILEKDVLTFLQISIEFYLGLGLTYVDKIRLQMEMDKATGQFWDFSSQGRGCG